MNIGNKVKVSGTKIEGKVIQKGKNGLVMINIIKGFNAFARTVYSLNELEEIR